MQMKFAAIAALSTVASATLFAAPAQAAPGVPFPIPGHGHELKLGPAKHFAKQNLADGDWVQTVRDGKTLYSRSTPVTVSPTSGPRSGTRSDFDGDGRDDLAVGSSAGVIVNYSSAAHRDQFATEAIGDELVYFGNSVVSGNFNGDGYDDLVIADVGEVDTATKGLTAGAIWIFYGSADGLLIDSVQHLNQSSPDVPGASETDDFFGGALAAGDITGDGVDDLAVGLPGESLGTAIGTGGIVVFQGSGSGVVTAGSQWIDQNTTGVPGSNESGDAFGLSLSIGKINKDGYGDLVVGSPYENYYDGKNGDGMLTQFWGSASGPSLTGVTSVTGDQVTSAVKTTGTSLYSIGFRTAVTDTNKDGYGEVIVGVDAATINKKASAGAIISLPGRSTGLAATGAKVFSQETSGVAGSAEAGDWFGGSIAVGDVTGDGYSDVLVGAPGEAIGTLAHAGTIVLLRGSSSGLTGTSSQSLDQNSTLVPGSSEADDEFGGSVGLLNLDGTGAFEALAGAPGEAVGTDTADYKAGTMTAFPVSSTGLGLGITTSGRTQVPTDDYMSDYGWNLVARQG